MSSIWRKLKDTALAITAFPLALSGCYIEGDAAKNLHPPASVRNNAGLPKESLELNPEDLEPPEWIEWYRDGVRHLEAKKYEDAIEAFNRSLTLAPEFGLTLINRGYAYRCLGDYEKAIVDFRKGLESSPVDGYMPRLYLAEILASCPVDQFRNGMEAIQLAKKGCEMTQWKHGPLLAVLASAYAETGDFKQAIHWQTEANQYLRDGLFVEMASRLELYRNGKPCRELIPDPWRQNK